MKKIFFLIYFIFLKFGLSFQCVPMFEYRIENNKLMFGSKIVEKADIETFEQLDVNFGEDDARKRISNAAKNFNLTVKTALALLQRNKTKKLSVKRKALGAAFNMQYKEELMKGHL